MSRFPYRPSVFLMLCAGLASVGCSSVPGGIAAGDGQVSTIGTIVSIDTVPWTYDGNAVIELDTPAHGRMAVKLPARWNLCKAAAVDVEALATGIRVIAVGTVDADGMVVCEREEHRLVPAH